MKAFFLVSQIALEVLYLQPMIPSKRFDSLPPDWGMLRTRCVQILL